METEYRGCFLIQGALTNITGIQISSGSDYDYTQIPRGIVRHPIHGDPYIPGSVFRGAVKRAMERRFFQRDTQRFSRLSRRRKKFSHLESGSPLNHIFGRKRQSSIDVAPGRVTFQDSYLTASSSSNLEREFKVIYPIDPVSAKGKMSAFENIAAYSQFNVEIKFSIFGNTDLDLFRIFLEGLWQLETWSLGGNGSRGLGQVRIGKWEFDKTKNTDIIQEGISLFWRSKNYYCGDEAEEQVLYPKNKQTIEQVIEEYLEDIKPRLTKSIN